MTKAEGSRDMNVARTLASATLATFVGALIVASSALGSGGSLAQKSGLNACVSETGSAEFQDGVCIAAPGLGHPFSSTVSADGKNVYVLTVLTSGKAVVTFNRDQTTGNLTQQTGPGATFSVPSEYTSLSLSSDGKNAYVISRNRVDIYDRDPVTGTLTLKTGPGSCITATGVSPCVKAVPFDIGLAVSLTPDGKNAYVTSNAGTAIFDRDPSTGNLTQIPGTEGCLTKDGAAGGTNGVCINGVGEMRGVFMTSPDGKNVYDSYSTTTAIFDRDPSTGKLTQKPGTDGCLSNTGSDEAGQPGVCADIGRAMSITAISPDGKNVYATSGNGLYVFDRDPSTGKLALKAGRDGCFEASFPDPECSAEPNLQGNGKAVVSPDGNNIYYDGYWVTIFDRGPSTGKLRKRSGPGGCISADGEDGMSNPCIDALNIGTLPSGDLRSSSITLSPDGQNAYITSYYGLAIFDRDSSPRAAETAIDSNPPTLTNDNTPTFAFSSDQPDSGFQCRVDATAFAACSSPNTTAALGDGPHTFEVRATGGGALTDPTPASRSFTVDTTPPNTAIGSSPPALTNDNTPSFGFSSSEAGSSLECRVDSGSFGPCSSPFTSAVLGDGLHSFEVRATDGASNTDPTPASHSFTVDTAPPDTTITSGPALTNDNTPTFGFSSSESGSSFLCRIDSAPFALCGSPFTASALSDGPRGFQVRAVDPAGNIDESPAGLNFAIDTAAPTITISKRPKARITTRGSTATATVEFAASEAGATLTCKLDTATYAPCSSPYRVKAGSKGGKGKKHSITITATDQAGNVGTAVAKFTVVRTR